MRMTHLALGSLVGHARRIARVAVVIGCAVGAPIAGAATTASVTALPSGGCQINAIGDSSANTIIFDDQGSLTHPWRVRDVGGTVTPGANCVAGGSSSAAFCMDIVTGLCNGAGVGNLVFNGVGNDGNDSLTSLNGFIAVFDGGNGADSLNGGLGADVLTGGAGADNFTDAGCGFASGTFFGYDLFVFGDAGFDDVTLVAANYSCLLSVQLGTQ
jgi:Ca2+-binding RTX toxin-like protein